jgi:hypothetical protein
MSQRTVLRIEPDGPDGLLRRLKVEEVAANRFDKIYGQPFDLKWDQLPAWGAAGVEVQYGKALYQALAKHPGVAEALNLTFQVQVPAGEVRPIYFYLDAPDAELVCWEALCNDVGESVALKAHWPIGRIANSPVAALANSRHDCTTPFKIMAVISALGDKPGDVSQKTWDQGEWDKLYAAVQAARRPDFRIQVQAVVGQEELFGKIAGLGDADVKVCAVPPSAFKLRDLIGEFEPHLLHFFCHGKNDTAGPRLELARISDWDQDPAKWKSSVELRLDDFYQITCLNRIWLVALNCCEGSKASPTEPSLTHALVARGVPVAVGMLESVEPKDANEFSEYFYRAALTRLREIYEEVRQDGQDRPIEWTMTLSDSRAALKGPGRKGKNDQPAWTLPVIYVRPSEFRVHPVAGPAPSRGDNAEAQALAGLHGLMGLLAADSPQAARLRELLAGLQPLQVPPAAPPVPPGV